MPPAAPLPAPRATLRLDARESAAGQGAIEAAAQIIAAGGLVAFPTETVYGLGADAGNPRAVAGVYAAKGRPAFNPLIAHVPHLEAAAALGEMTPAARLLAQAFWPGPLTLVLPCLDTDAVCELARAGLDTLAVRVPAHPVARTFLEAAGRPVVGPSANRSGHVSPTDAAHVLNDLSGRIDAVLDAGPSPVGVESTIVDCSGPEPRLLRPGGLSRDRLEAVLGHPLPDAQDEDEARPQSPGRLASHYAPRATIRLQADDVRPGEALLTFGGRRPPGSEAARLILDLSPAGTLEEAAANLYAALRRLDAEGVDAIAVVPLPREGLGEAIADRLSRAAAPRPVPEGD
ncbi:MAG: L-threonylcarbamoyladenylate synthase [Pseudomonadota bacterium]